MHSHSADCACAVHVLKAFEQHARQAGHEGGTPAGSLRRNSLAGMFPFLQKQPSMDTGEGLDEPRQPTVCICAVTLLLLLGCIASAALNLLLHCGA